MKSWMAVCIKDHKNCTSVTSGDFLPTRLLDVRGPMIRLVDSKDLNSAVESYVALSYCWGTTMPETGKTTKETEVERRREIDYTLLPRTLREAIHATQALGFSYIWIDALCIIQEVMRRTGSKSQQPCVTCKKFAFCLYSSLKVE